MTSFSDDLAVCVVCRKPALPNGRSDCYLCGEYFHLRLTTTAGGPDCGDVWIDDEVMALQFACRRCLDERLSPQPQEPDPEPSGQPRLRRVRRAEPGTSARDIARKRRR